MTFPKKIKIAETKMPGRVLCLLCLILILSTCFKLWLVGAQHLTALGDAVLDDRLFINSAKALLSGKWLGPYDNAVLAKGPFYPMWIAMVSVLGMPLLLAQHLLYAAACALFVTAVRPLLEGVSEMITVFLILLFNPMSYMNGVMTQVTREGIYPALTVFVFACASGLLVRVRGPVSSVVRWAAGLGFSLSVLWLTREEGLWIVPGIIFISVAAVVSAAKAGPRDWKRISLLFLPALIMLPALGSVAKINSIRYGVAAVTEMTSPEFLAAYGALLRVKHKDWKLTVPVPEDVRQRLYAVSPAFAELKPSLEGELGKMWSSMFTQMREACKRDPEMARKLDMYLKMDASGIWKKAFYEDDGDILGGGFLWAFRGAAASAGHYKSGKASREYYRRLAEEVNTACAEGRLDCGPQRASLMPPWHHEYDYPLLKTFIFGAFSLAMVDGFDVKSSRSYGEAGALKLFSDITHERPAPSEFEVLKGPSKLDESKIKVLGLIADIYRVLVPVFAALALVVYLIDTRRVFRGGLIASSWIIAGFALIAVICRLIVLSLIHVTSFPGILPTYLAPAYPLLVIFIIVVLIPRLHKIPFWNRQT